MNTNIQIVTGIKISIKKILPEIHKFRQQTLFISKVINC